MVAIGKDSVAVGCCIACFKLTCQHQLNTSEWCTSQSSVWIIVLEKDSTHLLDQSWMHTEKIQELEVVWEVDWWFRGWPLPER